MRRANYYIANGQNKSCQCTDDYRGKRRKKIGQCYCVFEIQKVILRLMMLVIGFL